MKANSTTVSVPFKSFEEKNADALLPPPIGDWVNAPTVQDLDADYRAAKPAHDLLVGEVEKWRSLRDVKSSEAPKGTKKEANRSTIQPRVVRKTNEWRYPALSEPFLTADKLLEVTPRTFEDAAGATQNELLLNHQVAVYTDKVKFIDELVHTLVDDGTALIRTGWERHVEIYHEPVPVMAFYLNPDPAFAQQIEQFAGLKEQNPRGYNELPEEIKASIEYSLEMGAPHMAVPTGEIEMQERERVIKNYPTADLIDFENVVLDPASNGDVDKANFAIFSLETTKAALLADGRYKNLEHVNWISADPATTYDHKTRVDGHYSHADELRRPIVLREYWGLWDINGDNRLVPIVAAWVGGTLVRLEENPYPDEKIPLITIAYLRRVKSYAGETDAELLEDSQAITGALTRGMIDLMGRSANGQTGISKSLLDPLNSRRFHEGKDFEFNPTDHPERGIYQLKYPEIPNSALTMLQLQQYEGESLTGVKAFTSGLSSEAYGQVATGIKGVLSATAMREMSIVRRISEGLEKMFRKWASMNATFLSKEEVVRITNEQFVEIKREDLKGEFDFKVKVQTPEVENAKAQDLGFLFQTLGNTAPFEITKKILVKIALLKGMPDLAKEIERYEPQPDPLEQKKKELEIAELELRLAEVQAKTMEIQTRAALNQAKTRETEARADMLDLDFIEEETGTKHARDMDKQGAQAAANKELEIAKTIMNAATDPTKSTRQAVLASHLVS